MMPIQVGGGEIEVYYLREPVGVVGEGVRLSVGLMIIMRVRRLLRMRWILGMLYLRTSFFLFSSTSRTPLMNDWCRLKMIDHYVGRGSHFVECQLLGEEGQSVPMFKIIQIFAT